MRTSLSPAVVLSRVTLGYGSTLVFDDLSVELAEGQTHCLLGPSGCGKSTLLKAITGLVIPVRGAVTVLGRRVEPAGTTAQRQANRETGLVLQDGGLFPHLTVRANIALPGILAAWPSDRIESRLADLQTLVGLSLDLLNRYPRELSAGQRQRVALARALLLDPPLLLLDEPLSSLDPLSRTQLQDEMRRLFQALAKTVVFVTHDLAEALFLADTITLFDRGRMVQHGAAEALARSPASEWARSFLGSAMPRWRRILELVDGDRER